MERLLCQRQLTDVQLRQLVDVVARAYEGSAVERGIVGCQCQYLELFARPGSVDPDEFGPLPAAALLELYTASGLAAREGVRYLDLMAACLAAAQQPASERCQASAVVEARFQQFAESSVLLKHTSVPWYLLTREVRSLARLRCAQAALAVERFRLARGRPPESLAELVPDYLDGVPEDPYDGEPLRYGQLGRGFVVYSVAENGVDEGGREFALRENGGYGRALDVAFAVTR